MTTTRLFIRAALVGALALGTAAAAFTAPSTASPSRAAAALTPAMAAAPLTAAPVAQDVVCTVNDNGVNYRSGPGPEYAVLGTVDRGQKLNAHGQEGSWVMGDLWGGRTGVWIHIAYLDC